MALSLSCTAQGGTRGSVSWVIRLWEERGCSSKLPIVITLPLGLRFLALAKNI
ncbi:hypothetical protein B0I35DRAFT_216223 [Stachybotrys elegans]|uniref:Uncharacterized protein n=1 Tax=Stachybotrys elegans TaxID=80388 RepID=A0A8K0WR03_9HYPO|nr:hypothetical protein B0I35DRAFT_216223 [Stachybotrys elegans]